MILARDTAQHGRLARTDDLAPEGDAVDHAAVRSDDASGGLEGRREREVLHREIFDRPLVAAEQSEGLARRGRLHVSDRVALAVEHAAEDDARDLAPIEVLGRVGDGLENLRGHLWDDDGRVGEQTAVHVGEGREVLVHVLVPLL